MRRNVIFVIVFALVIVGLVQLHKSSLQETATIPIEIKGIVELKYPSALEERTDIPFEKLVDPEYKKSLPDTIDYESFRPHKIFLERGFDANDPEQLKDFSNIVMNANEINGFDANALSEDMIRQISENVRTAIEQNTSKTTYRIENWKSYPVTEINGAKAFRYEYSQTDTVTGKTTKLHMTYLFKNNRQFEILLTSSPRNFDHWLALYNQMVNTIVIK